MQIFLIVFYGIVAILGLYLISFLFREKMPKLLTGIIHGSLGLIGLAIFIFYISFLKGDTPVFSFLFLLAAFFLGSIMISLKLTGKNIPKLLAVIHALIASAGIILLINFV